MLGIFIYNNSFFNQIPNAFFKDTDFPHKPRTIFQTNYFQTNFSNVVNNTDLLQPYIFKNFVNLFIARFII